MNQEIERKFLLKQLPPHFEQLKGAPMEQGYLAIEPQGNQVRLRKKGDTVSLTVKRGEGLVRDEHEIEFDSAEAAREFVPPDWFAEDVSERPEYSNRNLARE